MSTEFMVSQFRTHRYFTLNEARWKHFLTLGIPIKGKTIFEPGAGIGDQTEWLLSQGAGYIYVNDGRQENLEYIKARFNDWRLEFILGNLEKDLSEPAFDFEVDFIYCYGVYYHLNESLNDMNIMRGLAEIGPTIALDFLEGQDTTEQYGYDNPSTSISRFALRPRTATLAAKLKEVWGHCYLPRHQLPWKDPENPEPRLIIVGSKVPLESEELIEQ